MPGQSLTYAASTIEIPHLENYLLLEMLGESLQATVYKGLYKHSPSQPLMIKILKLLATQDEQSRHLRQKIERLKVLHDPRVLTPLSLESDRNRQFIVQPWFDGHSLNRWREQQRPLHLEDFLMLAVTLADILQVVHDAGITHGGVKPHNILLQPGTYLLKLTDFITPLDIRDVSHFIYDAEFVRNTLAYTSPEQTGRINYRVDFSTDLYSLGIVCYELLSGRLPFFSTDPLELIHSHLAEEAVRVDELNPGIPEVLADIIAQLMSKQPEKRYQNASGLLADFMRCQQEFTQNGSISHFVIGQQDRIRRVVFISKMVGRQAESELIQLHYAEVIQGKFRSVFISGLSGIGKTRLIQELQKPLVKNRGYFTSGKFDQYQKNIPYSSLLQALRNLMRTFLTESDDQVKLWRAKIIAALEHNGRVMIDVIPELEFIVGPQPEVANLPPVEARNRFNNLFGRFLRCLATEENPLVLFIDDLQWCDSATFDFLQNLFNNHQDHRYLFFMGAYRHNEVDASHPLTKLIRKVQGYQGPLVEIRLEALSDAACHEMVAYILDSTLDTTANLAEFIAHLTEGNPLFVSESLAWLYNENLLHTDAEQHWFWDMQRIRETNIPASVVELFSSKVRKLPVATLHILDHCACMGNRFTVEEVAQVLDFRIDELFEALKSVLSLGLLLENKSDLQFVHDRVQESVLRQVEKEARPAIHWRIGKRLLADQPVDDNLELLDNLFTIAAHLNLGKPVQLEPEQCYQLAKINFHAGNKALEALAGEAANEFFRKAHDILPHDCWEFAYELTYRIYQRLAKTDLMCGRYEASEALLNDLIVHALTDLDKAEALAEQTTSLSSFGNFNKAILTANRGLGYFNKAIPSDPEQAQRRMQLLMNKIAEQGDVWQKILHMPFTHERKSKIELAFYSELIPDLYMSGLVPQLYLSAAQSTLHCLQGGMDESVIYSFSIMGLNLGEHEEFDLAFRYQDLAHDLCAMYPNTFGATRGMNGIVWCNMHSRSHPHEIVEYCHRAIQCGKNCGDLYNAGLSYGPLMWNLIVQGNNLALVAETAAECLQFSTKNQLLFSVGLAEAVLAGWVEPMQGDQPRDMQITLTQWQENNYVAATGSYYVLLGFAHYYLGHYAQSAKALQQVEHSLHGLTDNVLKRLWYVFRILNNLRLADPSDCARLERELKPLLTKIETWARLGPLLQPYVAFIYAEMVRCKGDFREARNLYLDAIGLAQSYDYLLLTGHLYECLAEVIVQGQLGVAEIYFMEARRFYTLAKADSKLKNLQHYHEFTLVDALGGNLVPLDESLGLSTLPNLDVNYLMKSALALSAETELSELIQKIMTVVLESSSAQHGYLLILQDKEIMIVAERHTGIKIIVHKQNYPLQEASNICHAVVNYVLRTREKIVLRDASVEGEFKENQELLDLGVRSLLCLPVIKQTQLVGVLYLENRLSVGVFTSEKIDMTELLCSQAAISLENARLLEETRHAYMQLQENQEHLLQMEKLSALGTLVGGVAHEINNPLMGVMNFVEFVCDRTPDEKSREILTQAMQQIQRIKKIVSNMLVFVRNKSNLTGSCNIQDILQQTLFLLEGELRKTEIQVSNNLPNSLPAISCNSDILQQILVNLLINARDALTDCVQPTILVDARVIDDWLELMVCDNGVGIAQEIQQRIFDPFFTTKPPGKGTGLGLSVTRRLMQDVGGSIMLESQPGNGCCMRLKFRLWKENLH